MSILTPVKGIDITYRLQFPLTPPLGPNNCMLVSMSAVRLRTKKMKQPTMTMPGRSMRWAMRIKRMMLKMMARAATVTTKGKSLERKSG